MKPFYVQSFHFLSDSIFATGLLALTLAIGASGCRRTADTALQSESRQSRPLPQPSPSEKAEVQNPAPASAQNDGWLKFEGIGKITEVTLIKSTGTVHVKVSPSQKVQFLIKDSYAAAGNELNGWHGSIISGDRTLTMRLTDLPEFNQPLTAERCELGYVTQTGHLTLDIRPHRIAVTPIARPLSAKERKAQDEAAILLEVLRDGTRGASKGTYVGIDRENDVADPTPEMMRVLLTDNPGLRPVSDLLKTPNAKPNPDGNTGKIWADMVGNKPRFILIKAGSVRWRSADQVEISRHYVTSGGGSEPEDLVAIRKGTTRVKKTDRVTKSGWILRDDGRGRSGWMWMTITRNVH